MFLIKQKECCQLALPQTPSHPSCPSRHVSPFQRRRPEPVDVVTIGMSEKVCNLACWPVSDLNVRIEKASTHHPPAYLNPTVHRLNGNEHVQHAALTAHIPQKTSKSDVCHAPHSAVTRHPIACDQQRTPRTNQPIASAAVRGKEPLYQEYGIRDHPATEIAIRERIRRTRATVYYLAQTRGKRRT